MPKKKLPQPEGRGRIETKGYLVSYGGFYTASDGTQVKNFDISGEVIATSDDDAFDKFSRAVAEVISKDTAFNTEEIEDDEDDIDENGN